MWQYLCDYYGMFEVWLYCSAFDAAYELTVNNRPVRLVDEPE